MASSPASPPPPPPDASASPSGVKRTRKASRLRSLSTRPAGAERPVVHVDSATGKADGPHRKKLRTYLGIVARDKVDVMYENWKKDEKKLLKTIGERWRQFKSDLTRKWALAADQDGVDDTVCEKYDISKEKWAQFCQTRRDPSWEKLQAEKMKKKLEEAVQSGSVDGMIDPSSPVRRHDSFEEHATQGSFVLHGRQDVLTTTIGRLEHPGCIRVVGAGVTIKQYFGSAPRMSRNSSSLPPEELQQLTQQIKDQLEESIREKVTRKLMASFS
ncbi:hypothetical protein GmHk_02G004700 [Glycine max]|nr:hypothetical protein GmHk_02G004700 [Glycine max]